MYRHRRYNIKSRQEGFTLLELLITVALVGLLATIGIPNFMGTVSRNRLTTHANEFISAINLARSEAIKRNQPVSMIRTGTNWEYGWDVITDPNTNGSLDAGEILIRRYPLLNVPRDENDPNKITFTLRSTTGFNNRVTFQATGISGNGSFVLCDNKDSNNIPEPYTSKVIIINNVGRARIGSDRLPDLNGNGIKDPGDGNGIPEKLNSSQTLVDITSCVNSPFTS